MEINNLSLHIKYLKKEEQSPKLVEGKIETKKTIEKINETKRWFFKKTSKIDKPLARIKKKKRERVQSNKIRNDTTEIQRIIRDSYELEFPSWRSG